MQADATGALEAIKAAVGALPQDRVATRFLLAAASDITTSDVDLAFASGGIILGFNSEPSEAVLSAAKQLGMHTTSQHKPPGSFSTNSCIISVMRGKILGGIALLQQKPADYRS